MPKKPKELERIILEDGWVFKMQTADKCRDLLFRDLHIDIFQRLELAVVQI